MIYPDLTRRSMLLGTGALILSGCVNSRVSNLPPDVVETAQGRYQGVSLNGVQVFKGMRYGAATGGPLRFMPPRPAESFAGIQDALSWGDSAPQLTSPLLGDMPQSEDCLRINVWTPAADNKRRPVLLWFHGGGWEAGHGSGGIYDGTNMALRGDVVVCTINHRLNVFGYCDLSGILGAEYAQSGNVGYLDLVAAMKWVQENISQFGGDPNNIMIYGQSGGGRKVSVCYAGTEAAGQFQKGVVQSGSHNMVQTAEQSSALTEALLKELSIAPGDALKLKDVPISQLSAAQRKVIGAAGYRFEPNLDGISFTEHPFVPQAPRRTAQVPMMVGHTRTELANQLGRDERVYQMDDAGLRTRIERFFPPEDVDELIGTFRESNPDANPTELYFIMTSWRSYVLNATVMAEKRAELNGSENPTWMYNVTWHSPAENGRRYSQHTIDLPFMFDNVATSQHLTGPPSEETEYMTQAMAGAWLAFSANGNPNHSGIPDWPTYDLANRPVMHFEVPARVVNDPFRAEREFMSRYDVVRATARRGSRN
ncbi:carboxylesterase family protein [Henriciella sp. AS95]|uniref:carboxylesterase/lipase family protein n=1 Tax=Henriciella sp. AS95 TaxID=3135782 RepID=UPI003179B19C